MRGRPPTHMQQAMASHRGQIDLAADSQQGGQVGHGRVLVPSRCLEEKLGECDHRRPERSVSWMVDITAGRHDVLGRKKVTGHRIRRKTLLDPRLPMRKTGPPRPPCVEVVWTTDTHTSPHNHRGRPSFSQCV